jgi:competence protein ComEC
MPRAGWLAVGAVLAALVAPEVGVRTVGGLLAAAGALLVVAVGAVGPGRVTGTQRSAAATLVGASLIVARLLVAPPAPVPDSTTLPTGSGPWTAVVEAAGSPKAGQQLVTLRLVDTGDIPIRVAATLSRYPAVEPGLRIVVEGAVQPRPDSPYGSYLERIGVAGTIRSRTLSLDPSGAPEDPIHLLESLRRWADRALARALPEPEAGLGSGILIGLRERVDRDLAADFTTAGVSHVVAISGWNIAIVAAAIGAMAGRLGRRRRSVLTLIAIVAYVAFSGGSPSVVRAAAMAGVVLLARESGRAGRAASALGWAATLLLLGDPGLIRDAGFQLSSLATGGLIVWASPLTERIERLGRGRIPRWLAEGMGVSLAAQAATLPVVLASFGRLALVAPAVNLFVVPVVPPAMAAGLIAFVGGALALAGAPAVVTGILALPGWIARGHGRHGQGGRPSALCERDA